MEPNRLDWIAAITRRLIDECPYEDSETRNTLRRVLEAGLEVVGPESLVGTEVIEEDYFSSI